MKHASRVQAVRRAAARRGLTVSLSRVRDPHAVGYGRWTVHGPGGRRISPARGWTLEQFERWLGRPQGTASDDREAH